MTTPLDLKAYTRGAVVRNSLPVDELTFEAWERMTFGGLGDVQGPGVYKTVDYIRGPYVVAR